MSDQSALGVKADEGQQVEELQTEIGEDSSIRDALEAAVAEVEGSEEETDAPEQAAEASQEVAESEIAKPASDTATDADASPAPSEADLQPVQAPHHWSADDQKVFAEMPRAAQDFMLRRHKEMEADYTRKAKEVAPLRKQLDHWAPYLTSIQATPDQAFSQLMGLEYQLRTGTAQQKAQVVRQIVEQYGVALNGAAPEDTETDTQTDPLLQEALAPLKQQVESLTAQMRQSAASQAQETYSAAEARVEDFKTATDEQGNLKYPHFDEVYDQMVALAQTQRQVGRQPDLGELYEAATWMIPDVRAKLLLAQQNAASQQQDAQRREKAKQARNASSSITGTPAGTTEQPKTLRQEIEAAAELHS